MITINLDITRTVLASSLKLKLVDNNLVVQGD